MHVCSHQVYTHESAAGKDGYTNNMEVLCIVNSSTLNMVKRDVLHKVREYVLGIVIRRVLSKGWRKVPDTVTITFSSRP